MWNFMMNIITLVLLMLIYKSMDGLRDELVQTRELIQNVESVNKIEKIKSILNGDEDEYEIAPKDDEDDDIKVMKKDDGDDDE